MIGVNTLSINMDQAKDIIERHLKDEILRDADFSVTKIELDYQAPVFRITLGPKVD